MVLCLTGDVSVWYVSRSPCPSILANGTHTLTDGTSRHHNVHKNAFRCFTKTLVDAKVSVFFFAGIEPTSVPGFKAVNQGRRNFVTNNSVLA